MKRYKAMCLILTANIMLSSLSVNSFAGELPVIETSDSEVSSIDNVKVSVNCTDVTDTSLTISWNSVPNAESYSVICNNSIVAEGITDDRYEIADLQPGSEFFVSVQAFDAVGNVISESEENTLHTNLTVDSDMKLTGNLTVNSLRVIAGTLNMNGYSLTVENDTYITDSSAYVEIGSGSLYINGNLNFENESGERSYVGGLKMANSKGSVCVRGDINLLSVCSGTLSAGTLELCGDFNSNLTENWDSFNTSSSHKLVLSGRDTQTITLPPNSKLSVVEVKNFSEGGVIFTNQISISDLRDNGCKVSVTSDENTIGWTLNKDETFDGSMSLVAGTLDLNGHKLTITGDLLQSGGTVLVNGGVLEVQGDYRLQSSNGVNNGILNMTNDADIVRVSGDFVMQSNQSHDGKLSAGILEIGGDLMRNGNDYNFHTTEDHTVLINGDSKQEVDFNYSSINYSRITNLKIENTSDDGVFFNSSVYVSGDLYNTDSFVSGSSNIHIASETKFVDNEWNYDITVGETLTLSDVTICGNLYNAYGNAIKLGGDVHVKQSFYINSDVNLNGYTFDVDGDVWVASQLNLNRGRLNVGGDFNISSASFTSSYGYITMKYSTDYIYVDGNMLFYSNNNYSTLTNGTIEIKGDFTQKFNAQENNFYASGNHRVILSGNSLQKVHFDSSKLKLNILEIKNTSEAGVELFSKVQVGKIVSNDCNISYYDPEIVGRTLDGDKVVDGDLTIDEDTLDLNGHTLIVTGNLIHSGGTIYINNGALEVKGDYRIQAADGGLSDGKLLMTNESDIVKVAGDFVMQSTTSHKDCLTNGILEIGGDFSRFGGTANNISTSGNHTVILNGSAAQVVNVGSISTPTLTNLKIENSSKDGVTFAGNIYVAGILYNTGSVLNKSENINALSTTVIENNEWNHSITFSHPETLSDNLKIKGDVYFNGTVSLPGNSKYAIMEAAFSKESSDTYTLSVGGSIYTNGNLIVNGGSVFVGENLYVGRSGFEFGIKMNNEYDYILVNGNVYYQSGSDYGYELSKGTIELKGDFIQKGSFYKEKDASKDFCLLLSGSELQTISVEDSDFSFGTIDVDNHSEDGVYFASTVDYIELRKNGCNVKFRYEGTKGWTLSEDEVFEGDLTIASGILDLNGHKLTITGDLIQPGGTVWINGGELIVEGDYRIQTDSENEIVASSGALKMTNESDVVRVSGSFVMQSNKDHYENTMSAGILEIGGDLIVPSGGHYNNFRCSGDHTVVLNGTKKQNVYIDYSATYSNDFYRYDGSRINNLKIVNTSNEGVNFNGITLIVGELHNMASRISNSRNIYAVSSTVFADNTWNGDISFPLGILATNPLFIKGDVYSYGSLTVNPCDFYGQDVLGMKDVDSGEYSLIVDGNVYAYDMLNLPYHSSMIVSGDINIDKAGSNYYGGYISLNSDSKLFVGGTLRSSSNRSSSLRSGTLEIRGDLLFFNAENGLTASDDHTTIFSGEKQQTIYIDNTSSVFDIVEIKNYSDEGVCFETPVLYTELIDNGCKITQGADAVSGWTLTDDETVDGNLNLANGVLDLNGYKLTVNGDLIQSGGTVFVNGGELCVSGDYRIQSKRGEVYNNSLGIFKMTNEADIVRVSGNFVMQSTESHNGYLSAGTLEIGGDLIQVGRYSNNFPTSGLHTIVLNGATKQNIDFNNSSCSITNLIIRNTSSEGIEFVNAIYVTGKLYDTSSQIINGQKLYVTDTTDFADNAWSADITFSKTLVLLPDFYIGGSLYLNSDLVLVGDMVIAGSLYANSDINVNGYTLEIGKDLQLGSMLYVNGGKIYIGNMLDISGSYGASSGYLYMNKADDYVLVNGSVYIYSTQNTYFTNGTLEIKGDFIQKNYGSQTMTGFSGKVILSGNEVQRISVENTRFIFKMLEVTKPIDTGYVFSRTPMWNTLIENITDTEAPSAPSNLSYIDSTSTSIRIKWVGSKDNMSDCVYDVYRDGERIATVKDTEYIDNALIPYTEYTYYVVAHDASGNASELSNTLTARTNSDVSGLLQPTNLNFKIRADGSIYLSWAAPVNSDNTVIYNIYRNGAVIGTTGSTSYIDRNAEQGYHEYYVEAVDENSSAASDSVLVDNLPPEKPVLYISRITPTYISLNCSSEDNIGIASFNIYRNGELQQNINSGEYTDTSVIAGSEYSYSVIAIDTFGNTSEASDIIKVAAESDEVKPEVIVHEQTLTENDKKLKIICIDDVMLSLLTMEIRLPSSEEWVSLKPRALNQKSRVISFDLTDYLTDGGNYQVRAILTDAAGNMSSTESGFSYVKNELSDIAVNAEADGCSIKLNWTPASETAGIYYEIRRVDPDGTETYIATTKLNELSYTDIGVFPLSGYSYFVIAHDENLYSSKSNIASVTSGADTITPTAKLLGSDVTIEGYTLALDGTLSKDNFGIKSYMWDFGDGYVGEGANVEHIYSEEGTYTVTLTVSDESGNVDTDILLVTVYDSSYCFAEIEVFDEDGTVISNVAAYCELPDSTKSTYYTNNGVISLITKSGMHDFYFFADGYMPYKKSIELHGVSTDNTRQKITLTKNDLVNAEFEYRELELDEAINLGIDVTAAENQHLSVVTIKVDNAESGEKNKYDVIVDQSGDFLQIDSNGGITVKDIIKRIDEKKTSSGHVSTTTSVSTLQTGINKQDDSKAAVFAKSVSLRKTMVGISVTKFSWEKNFYEISISITNNADDDFSIDDCSAIINLPQGLSLAITQSDQTISQSIDTITGGTTKSIRWIVMADKSGSYPVSVSFTGVLRPLGIPIEALFESEDPIVVKGNDVLKLTLKTSGKKSNFELTNTASYRVDNVKVNFDLYSEFDGSNRIVLKYPSGMIEVIEWKDEDHTDILETVYLPVGINFTQELEDSKFIDFRSLNGHESIIGIIYRN